jgi:hypothetical protein
VGRPAQAVAWDTRQATCPGGPTSSNEKASCAQAHLVADDTLSPYQHWSGRLPVRAASRNPGAKNAEWYRSFSAVLDPLEKLASPYKAFLKLSCALSSCHRCDRLSVFRYAVREQIPPGRCQNLLVCARSIRMEWVSACPVRPVLIPCVLFLLGLCRLPRPGPGDRSMGAGACVAGSAHRRTQRPWFRPRAAPVHCVSEPFRSQSLHARSGTRSLSERGGASSRTDGTFSGSARRSNS